MRIKKIDFTKVVASGNDFVVVEKDKISTIHYPLYAKKLCDRKFGVGADGLLILEKSKVADIKMRIFNPDGSEAEMCGNGARCVALYLNSILNTQYSILKIETKAGLIESEVRNNDVKIKLTEPKEIKLNLAITINRRILRVNFINTGVPHTVVFVEGLDKIDVVSLARLIRYHRRFSPQGTNVNFVEIKDDESIKIRTYERGVEDETFACGTGAVASAIISNIKYEISNMKENIYKVNVYTRGGEILKVYFEREDKKFKNVWLEGKAKIVYRGVYYV